MAEQDTGMGLAADDAGRGLPWWALGCAGVALALAAAVGAVVFPVLAGILFPPEPPTPPGAVAVSHESAAYGFDRWAYTVPGGGCAVVAFYEGAGGACVLEAGHCGAGGVKASALAGTCTGVVDFSRFAMRWEAAVWDYPAGVELYVSREVAWGR